MYFEKISLGEWTDWWNNHPHGFSEEEIIEFYNKIELPKAGSQFAAGHDFHCPIPICISSTPVLLPTGIRWVTEEWDKNLVLLMIPRSGLGTKFGMRLRNTVGVIDADYYMAANEGHIMASITTEKECFLGAGDRFLQGVIVPYYRCGENSDAARTGGFGSTGK